MYVLEHIPFEFYQPYIQLLDPTGRLEGPAISGLVIGVSMFGGALGATVSARVHSRWGLLAMLVGAYLVQLLTIGALASWLHVAMLSMVALRNFPMALVRAPVYAAHRTPRGHRPARHVLVAPELERPVGIFRGPVRAFVSDSGGAQSRVE